jgi:hypothetical protein
MAKFIFFATGAAGQHSNFVLGLQKILASEGTSKPETASLQTE